MTSVVAPDEEQQLHQIEPQRDLATFNAVSTELSAAFPVTTTAAESDSPQKGLLLDPQQLRATNDERHSKEGNGASHSQEEEEEKNREEEEEVDESQFLMEKSGFPSMAARSAASAGSTASPKNRNSTDAPPTESDVGAQMLLQEDGETTAAAADGSCSSPLSASSKRLRYVRCLVYVEDAEDEAMRGVNNCEAHMKEAEPQDEEEDDATEGPIMTAADDVAPSDHDDDDGKHTTTTLEEEEHPKATEDGEKKPKKQKSVRMDPSIDHPKDRKEGDEEPQQPQPHDEGPHTGDVGGDGGDSTPAAADNGPMLLSHSNVGEPKRSKRVPTKTSIPAAAAVAVGRMGHYGTAPFRATAQRFHSHRTATSDVPFVALPSTTATTNNSIPHGKGFSTFGSAKDRFYVPPSATVHAMTMLTHAAPTSRSRSASSSAAATGTRRGSRSGSREPAAVSPEGGATATTATAAPAAGRSRSPSAALPHRAPQSRGSSADRFYRAPPATCNAPLYVPKGMGDVQRVGRNGPLTQTAPRFMTAGRSASSASSSSPAGGGVAGEDHPHHHPGSSDEVGGTPQYLSMTTRDREEKHLSTYRGVGAGAAVAAFRSTQPRFRDPVVNNQAPFRVGPSFVDEILRR